MKGKELLYSSELISEFGSQSLSSADLARLCGLTLNNSCAGYVIKQKSSALKQYPSTPQDTMWKTEIFPSQGSHTRELKLENEQEC